MKTRMFLTFALIFAVGTPLLAQATPPGLINYQGVLRDASDHPMNGAYAMTFRFYDGDGNLLLTDTRGSGNAVLVDQGLFNVKLGDPGSTTPGTRSTLAEMFGYEGTVYLEIEVAGDGPMTPRIRVSSTGYSLNAHRLDGREPSTFADAVHGHQAGDISGPVSDSDMVDGMHASEFIDTSANPSVKAGPLDVKLVDGTEARAQLAYTETTEAGDRKIGIRAGGIDYAGYFDGKVVMIRDDDHQLALGYKDDEVSYFWHREDFNDGDGQSVVKASRTRPTDDASRNDGTGYGADGANMAIHGTNSWGDLYSFAVAGHSFLDSTRTGGVLGGYMWGGGNWGSLGYKDSAGTQYGGYFMSTETDGTDNVPLASEGIGIGSYGGLLGGWVRGDVYGLYASGERFGSYTKGDSYVSGFQAFPQEVQGKRVASFAVSSPTVDIVSSGRSRLSTDKSAIEFPEAFTKFLSDDEPVALIVTPIGDDAPMRVSRVNKVGFEVAKSAGSAQETEFSWIAIGKRRGFEDARIVDEIGDPDFESRMDRVTFNENNLEDTALGMRYSGESLRFGEATPSPRDDKPDFRPRSLREDIPARSSNGRSTTMRLENNPRRELPLDEDGNVYGRSFRPSARNLASMVEVLEPVEAGDVLSIDPDRPGLASLSRLAADTAVLGIVAGEPGVILGARPRESQRDLGEAVGLRSADELQGTRGAAEVPLALSGFVMCKVDAGFGSIRPGDLLTTSPTPGHAMRADQPGPGTVLGKAVEPLDAGTGTIKVLVMLR